MKESTNLTIWLLSKFCQFQKNRFQSDANLYSCRMLSMLSRKRSLFRRQSKNIPQCFISSVTNFKLPSNKDRLTVQWDDGFESQFAAVWLRDNCPHPKITHPTSFGRLMLMEDLDTDITIKEVKFSVSKGRFKKNRYWNFQLRG